MTVHLHALRRLALALGFVIATSAPVWAQQPDAGPTDPDATEAVAEDATEPAAEEDTAVAPAEDDAAAAPEDATEAASEDATEAASEDATEGHEADATEGHEADATEGHEADAAPPAPIDEHGASLKGEPPAGEAPAVGEHEAPKGDVDFDQLMPSAEDMKPEDLDGDGQVSPEEEDIPFSAGKFSGDYASKLKGLIESMRGKIIAKMIHKTTVKQGKAMGFVMKLMLGLTAAGFLILLLPLFMKKKYPGREKLLWKGAFLGTVAWVSTMLVFTGAMFVMRTAKNETAMIASPPLAVANAAFDAAKDQVDFLAEDAPVIIEAPIAKLASGQADGMLEAVLENVGQFRSDLSVFKALADFFKSLNWLISAFGVILLILAVVFFMLSQKQVLGDILRLPGRAAAGDAGSFAAIYADMQRRTFREVVALVATIGILIVAALFSGFVLYMAIGPAVSAVFDYVIFNIYYILGAEQASKMVVYTSLFGIGIFLGVVILFVLLANAFFLGKVQKVLQQKFRHQLPAANYKKFFLWGPISAIWVQILPVIFIVLANVVVDAIVHVNRGEAISWGGLLLTGPLVMLIGLPVFVWLAQGFRALKFLRKFDHLTGSPEAKR